MHISKEEALFFPLNLLSEEEIKPRNLQEEEEVGTASKKNHSVSILPALLEAECSRGGNGMMQLDSPCEPHIPKSSATNEERNAVVGLKRIDAIVSPSTFKPARWDSGITKHSLEEVGTASEENHTAHIWHAAGGRGGMLLQQEDSSSEPHIPESSATNEERNNVVELNNSIDDAKGGNSSSEKTDTIIWEKDHGINRQALELFGTGEMLLQQEDSSSEPHIPESSAINEERNNAVELNNSIDDAKGGNSCSDKTKAIRRWEKDHGITHQVLEQLFGKSREDAAKTLKVSTSTFKRSCRDLGITRWPNHGKRPKCSLNQNQDVQAVKKHKGIQPCPALPPLQATNTGQCNNAMSVKVEKYEEINQGTFEPKKYHDISSAVLGKKDHLDSVRGVDSYSTIQGMFGRPDQERGTSSRVFTIDDVKEMMDKCRQDTIIEMEAKMQPKIDSLNQQLQLIMKNMSATQVSVGTPRGVYTPFDPPPTHSSCHLVDTYPVTTIKSPKKCTLAICPGGTPTFVAKGMAQPSTDETVVHHQPSSTIGNFAQLPMHLVILDENLSKENKKTKDQSGDISATSKRPPIVNDDALHHLGYNCKYLVKLLTSFPLDKDYIALEIDKSIFHHQNTSSIFVMIDNIKDLLTMKCLNVPIIQVFILYLNWLCNERKVMSIGFACPTQISKNMLELNTSSVTNYFIHVMEKNKDKQFILAPYYQDYHWLLLVISICKKTAYVLDSFSTCKSDIPEVKASLNMAFRLTNKRSKTIDWIQCKCPRQPGRVECGYYVMRYMFDIVTKYSHVDRLDKAFKSKRSYPMDYINEIQDQWAKYFFSVCV